MKTYTTDGLVRGSCGHKHRTLSGAVRCLNRDHAGCKSQGGYSDRDVYDSEGERYMETESGGPYVAERDYYPEPEEDHP